MDVTKEERIQAIVALTRCDSAKVMAAINPTVFFMVVNEQTGKKRVWDVYSDEEKKVLGNPGGRWLGVIGPVHVFERS